MDANAPFSDDFALAQDLEFIRGPLASVPGWLNDISAAATIVLLRAQDEITREGGFVEIGVYGGKYLSLLVRYAASTEARVLGIDTFHHFSPNQVRAHVKHALGPDAEGATLHLIKASSQDIRAEDVRRRLRGLVRMFHIDGSHEGDDVLWDLEMAEASLSASGILIIDDFFSPHDAGVSEALFRFQILRPRPLVPIAYVANKLFLARHSYAAQFRSTLESFLMHDRNFVESQRFRDRLEQLGRRMIETRLFGHPYLAIT